MKKSKYAEKEITKFLQSKLAEELTPKIEQRGFIPPIPEKPFPGNLALAKFLVGIRYNFFMLVWNV